MQSQQPTLQAKTGHNVVKLESVNKLVALRAVFPAKETGEQMEEEGGCGVKKVIHPVESRTNLRVGEEEVMMGGQIVMNNNDAGSGGGSALGEDHKEQEQKVVSDQLPHICPTCKQTFSCQSNLNVHVKRTHQKVRKFGCPEVSCGATFFRVATQQEHIRSKHRWEVLSSCTSC